MPIYKADGKKNGLQKYRVKINYVDNHGDYKQIERTAYGMAEAKELESRLLLDIKQSPTTKRMTLNELTEDYISTKKYDVRETTIDKHQRALDRKVLPMLGDTRIDKLNTQNLQEWKAYISSMNLKLSTRQYIYSVFRTLLNYAVKMEYLPKNPLVSVGNFKDPNDFTPEKEKLHYYTAEQYLKFIAVARQFAEETKNWSYFTFFSIAFYTGARKGEINALKWSDIDNDILHIRRSVAQKVKGKDIVETPPKNKSSYRDLQIPKPLLDILAEQKARHMKSPVFSEDFRVCGGEKCLSDTSISNKNIEYAEKAKLPIIRVHDFRHSHASLLVNEGINIQEIARRLGHAQIEITWNTYSHLYPREEERAVSILNKII